MIRGDTIHYKDENHEFYAIVTQRNKNSWAAKITKMVFTKWLTDKIKVHGSWPSNAIEVLTPKLGTETITDKNKKRITFEVKKCELKKAT